MIGESPGATEAKAGEPFTGRSGALLRQTLQAAKVDLRTVRFTNAALCAPAGDTPRAAIQACNERLMNEIKLAQPTKVLIVGGMGLSAALQTDDQVVMSKQRGRGWWLDTSVGGDGGLFSGSGVRVFCVATYHPAAVLRDPDLFRDFAADIQKLIRQDAPLPSPPIEVIVPESREHAIALLEEFRQSPVLSCDLETWGLDPQTDGIISIGFGALDEYGGGHALVIPMVMAPVDEILGIIQGTTYDGVLVFHNAKFDLKFLLGKDISSATRGVIDTMLLHYLHDERSSHIDASGRRSGGLHGLKDLARIWYDVPDYHFNFNEFFALRPDQRDMDAVYRYQGQDLIYTRMLYDDLTTELWNESPRLFNVYEQLLSPAIRTLAHIEEHGVRVDREYLDSLDVTMSQESLTLGEQLRHIASDMVDVDSPQQISGLLYDRWGLTRPQLKHSTATATAEADLKALLANGLTEQQSSFISKLLEYREHVKLHRTYVRGLLEASGRSPDGRVHPSFLLHGTSTGRLSCRDPNLQNIPKHGAGKRIRRAFVPSDGHVWLEADYRQLEYRVAAWYSQDPDMITMFTDDGLDIHLETAKAIFQTDDITSAQRDLAKRIGFGILYGMGADSLVANSATYGGATFTVKDAEHYINAYLARFPMLRQWIRDTQVHASQRQFVETPWGRRRRFPLIVPGDGSSRAAVNTPIQSLASDICLDALNRLHRSLTDARILLTVHDAIDLEVPADQLTDVADNVRTIMQDVPLDRRVPFPVSVTTGDSWAAM